MKTRTLKLKEIAAGEETETGPATCTLTPHDAAWTLHLSTSDGTPLETQAQVESTAPNSGRIRSGSQVREYHVVRQRDRVEVWFEGRVYRFQGVTEERSGAAHKTRGNGELKAPMPGTVLKVLAHVGDAVAEKTPLIIMESMKMELTLAAPFTGVVEEVGTQVGALVDMGALLMRVARQEA